MAIPIYTLGYPPDGSSLGQTKTTIRNNLDGTFLTLGGDHVNNNGQPGSNPAGYHTIIHEVTQSTVSTVTGYNQVFAGVPGALNVNATTTPTIPTGGDTQLYSLSGGGILSQLTGSLKSTDGFAWSGGILLQWGLVTSPGNSGSVTFPVAFPNACLSVQLTIRADSTNTSRLMYLNGAPVSTGFSYNGTITSTNFLYWLAVGY